MNPKLYRIVAGFLCVFVVISLAPHASGMVHAVVASSFWPTAWASISGMSWPKGALASVKTSPLFDLSGPLPLAVAAALTLLLIASMTRRHLRSRSAVPASASGGVVNTSLVRSKERYVATARKNESLGAGIRQAVAQGERAPALARRLGLSQDAIRAATGRSSSGSVAPVKPSLQLRPRASVVLRAPAALPNRLLPRIYA